MFVSLPIMKKIVLLFSYIIDNVIGWLTIMLIYVNDEFQEIFVVVVGALKI